MSRILIVILTLTSAACFGQQARPAFTLGMTVDELRQKFGVPTRFYDVQLRRYLDSDTEAQVSRKVSGDQMVQDVYEIKTPFNTYEFQTRYFYDESQSRFRPTKKLVEVAFEIDRPVQDVRLLLADFPEAAELCSQECTVFADEDDILGKGIIVQPTNPSQEHIKAAGLMATGWRENEDPKFAWAMGFKFTFNPLKEKQIESGSYGLMIKGKSRLDGPITRIGVWRAEPK